MKKYLVEQFKTDDGQINYWLYDIQWYSFDSVFTSTHRSIHYDKEKQEYCIEFWYANLEEIGEWPYDREPIDVIEEFDTLAEVKEKYILSEESYEMPYEGDISYIDPILITKKAL